MKRWRLELWESVKIAFEQIQAHRGRALLTALGVIIGIMAVTLMGVAIRGIDKGVEESLSVLGDDVFYITRMPWGQKFEPWLYRNRANIETSYAEKINASIADSTSSLLQLAVPTDKLSTSLKYDEVVARPIEVLGTNADFMRISKLELREGRFFNEIEALSGKRLIILGADVADALFANGSALEKNVQVRGEEFLVIGVAKRQGSFLGMFSMDGIVLVPLHSMQRMFSRNSDGGEIRVKANAFRMDEAREELRGLMRKLRGLRPEQPDDFEINTQEGVEETISPIRNGLAIAGLGITSLALFVGAIGIMNITYVSVKERTREIGTRMALGARRRAILMQFLTEAVAICFVGGVVGILLALGGAAAVGFFAPTLPAAFSLDLIAIGLAVSVLTGVLAGFIPALSASRLNPVEALRYE